MMGVLDFYPNQFWYCTMAVNLNLTSNICSTLFILNMTFGRFYGIIMPHKGASFNTVHRVKITISICVIVSIMYNIPHIFISSEQGGQCVPYGNALKAIAGQIYYWLSYVTNFVLPFVLLLIMNSFIIHTIRNRSKVNLSRSTNQGEGQDKQVFAILLLVTFAFLILTTPVYMFFLYTHLVDYEKTAKSFAEFQLFYSVSQKMYYTNYLINFCLYVLSGQKFRTDLKNLFWRKDNNPSEGSTNSPDNQTKFSTIMEI